MLNAINLSYRRGLELIARLPVLIMLPVLAESAQHVAEIDLGMYAGGMNPGGKAIRLAFGAIKILAIFVTLVVAWRWWRFDGKLARALRPTGMMFKGIGLFLLVQFGGEAAALALGRGLAALPSDASASVRFGLTLLPLLGWLFVSGALFPWYVALVTEDRSMRLRSSVQASRGRLLYTWALLLAGVMPLMCIHYALNYAALLALAPAAILMILDAAIVGALVAMIAATYFTIYARASARLAVTSPGSN